MRISIVTPSLNQGKFIKETINSVINQKGDFELEYIIMDGKSSDNSLEIIKKYDKLIKSKRFKPKCKKLIFKWFSEKDSGQSEAINNGFRMCTGEIINWLCADDCLAEGALEKVNGFFKKDKNASIVTGGYVIYDSFSNRTKEHMPREFKREDFIRVFDKVYGNDYLAQPSTFLRKETLNDVGYLNEENHLCMDYEWYLLMSKKYKFYALKEVLSIIYYHSRCKSYQNLKEQRKQVISYAKKLWHERPIYYRFNYYFLMKPKLLFRGIDRRIGLVGIYLKENYPKLYSLFGGRQGDYPKNVAIIFIGTGSYASFFEKYYNSVKSKFLPSTKKTFICFSDNEKEFFNEGDVCLIKIKREKWPFSTLMRYKHLVNNCKLLKQFDYFVYLDADSYVYSKITEKEFFSNNKKLFGVQHPYFVNKLGTFENNKESLAYVGDKEDKSTYWQACFWGGETARILELLNELNKRVNLDLSKKIIAKWHDESYLNKYFIENKKQIYTFHPGYAYPYNEFRMYRKKIVHGLTEFKKKQY